MLRVLITLLLLIPVGVSATPVVHNSGLSPQDSIALPVICTDSIGNPIAADSFFVVVIGPSGDSVFSEAITTASNRVDSSLLSGHVVYRYHAAVADIDRTGDPGAYTLVVTTKHNVPLLYNTFFRTFQITGWELAALGDSTGRAAAFSEQALDSLGLVLDSLYAVLDSLQAGVGVAQLSSEAAADVWATPFAYSFPDGSLGDSVTSATWVQGEAASLDSATLAGWIWNTPQANHTVGGSFGSYLDANISGLGAGAGLYSVHLVVYDENLEQVVPYASLAIRNENETALIAIANTGAGGEATFSLDAGTYSIGAAAPGYVFDGFTTLTVAGQTVDTVTALAFDPGPPIAPALCRVYGQVRSVDGLPLAGAQVSAALPATVHFATTVISPQTVSVTVDADGYFAFDLIPSGSLIPFNTEYEITISHAGRTIVREKIIVPNTPSWQLIW